MKVTIELDELVELHTTAKLSEYRQEELERVKKENADLEIERERQAKEINGLRCELSTKPTTREVSPLLRQRIENAKDVLREFTFVVADADGNYRDVSGDCFNTVYKTLQELYDATWVEVQ